MTGMPDRHGTPVRPGDPVLLSEGEATATVLRDVGDGRYLVQLDPRGPTRSTRAERDAAVEADLLASGMTAAEVAALMEIDVQEPFEVDGADLEYFGDWES